MNENNSDKLSLPQALDLIKDREKESFCLDVNASEIFPEFAGFRFPLLDKKIY